MQRSMLDFRPVFSPDGAGAGGASPPIVPPAGTPPAGEEYKGMTPDAFKARLASERTAGIKAALAELGFTDGDIAQAKAKAEGWRKADEASKTELQRAMEAATAAQAKAGKADAYEKTIKDLLAVEEAAVPESKRGMLDLAPPAEQFHDRLTWLARARAKGLFADGTPAKAAEAKAPGNTQAGSGLPPMPAPAKHPRDMTDPEFEQYEAQKRAERRQRYGG